MLMANGSLLQSGQGAGAGVPRMGKKPKKQPGTPKALDVGGPKIVVKRKQNQGHLTGYRYEVRIMRYAAHEPSAYWAEQYFLPATRSDQDSDEIAGWIEDAKLAMNHYARDALARMPHCPKCIRRSPRMATDSGMTSSGHCYECWSLTVGAAVARLREKITERKASIYDIAAAEPIAPDAKTRWRPYREIQQGWQDSQDKANDAMNEAMGRLEHYQRILRLLVAVSEALPQMPWQVAVDGVERLMGVVGGEDKNAGTLLVFPEPLEHQELKNNSRNVLT